jgi:hypothetical protein
LASRESATVEDDLGDDLRFEGRPHLRQALRVAKTQVSRRESKGFAIAQLLPAESDAGAGEARAGRRSVPPAISVCDGNSAQTMA